MILGHHIDNDYAPLIYMMLFSLLCCIFKPIKIRLTGTLTLLLIKYISEEFAKYRLIPYLCCQKEESADRKGKLSRGLQSLESMNRLSPSCLVAKSR